MELTQEEELALEVINSESEKSESRTVYRPYAVRVILNSLRGKSPEYLFYSSASIERLINNLISLGKLIPVSYDFPKGGYIQPVE